MPKDELSLERRVTLLEEQLAAALETNAHDLETVRVNITISRRDQALLKEHRINTGETASAFIRRMIAENLVEME